MLHFPAEITNEFEVVDDINFGFFGVVYKVRRIADNKIYAMKTVVKKYGDAKSWKDVETEIKILSELNNPYLLHLERRIDQDNKVYMIIDYCENHWSA
ncbi:unnamed protein product [Blepharisma stoltei]|uniref:Protein kinase domain-containing protein n=1 Tax=Blepharisma stoltei TaxID=1481888 RepID=A0AAU9IBJ1_9CILI|nr:unnamed protein product [Blepharisma stoltei]